MNEKPPLLASPRRTSDVLYRLCPVEIRGMMQHCRLDCDAFKASMDAWSWNIVRSGISEYGGLVETVDRSLYLYRFIYI